MNTNILRKLSKRVQLVKEGKYYVIKSRNHPSEHWNESPTYSSFKKALTYKHNVMHRTISDMGFLMYFKERRLKKVNRSRRRLVKKGKLVLDSNK